MRNLVSRANTDRPCDASSLLPLGSSARLTVSWVVAALRNLHTVVPLCTIKARTSSFVVPANKSESSPATARLTIGEVPRNDRQALEPLPKFSAYNEPMLVPTYRSLPPALAARQNDADWSFARHINEPV
eukprot:752331-Hanusia_phi.AAC.2